jgi:hypothetical protein
MLNQMNAHLRSVQTVSQPRISPNAHRVLEARYLRHDATRADISHAYQRAFDLGLKGITVYRYGSKSSQVLQLGVEETPEHFNHAARCDPQECRL